jgi:hypothetical protein
MHNPFTEFLAHFSPDERFACAETSVEVLLGSGCTRIHWMRRQAVLLDTPGALPVAVVDTRCLIDARWY